MYNLKIDNLDFNAMLDRDALVALQGAGLWGKIKKAAKNKVKQYVTFGKQTIDAAKDFRLIFSSGAPSWEFRLW